MKKIGVLGGTFDPIHNGHLAIGEAARKALGLDEIWLMPAGNPPHKKDREITDKADRLKMVKLATEGKADYRVLEIELHKDRPSYTVDTYPELLSAFPDVLFRVIIGGDSLPDLKSWHRGEELLRTVPFAVCTRPGFSDGKILSLAREYEDRYHADIKWFFAEPTEVSSTEIRTRVKNGEDIDGMVPKAVADYIRSHHLYGKEI